MFTIGLALGFLVSASTDQSCSTSGFAPTGRRASFERGRIRSHGTNYGLDTPTREVETIFNLPDTTALKD